MANTESFDVNRQSMWINPLSLMVPWIFHAIIMKTQISTHSSLLENLLTSNEMFKTSQFLPEVSILFGRIKKEEHRPYSSATTSVICAWFFHSFILLIWRLNYNGFSLFLPIWTYIATAIIPVFHDIWSHVSRPAARKWKAINHIFASWPWIR